MLAVGPRHAVARWDQILVLAAVFVAADVAGFWWLTKVAPGDAAIDALPAVPDPSILDDDMARTVRRLALQAGVNPGELPQLTVLWELVLAGPHAGGVDVTDRGEVQAAFDAHLQGMARREARTATTASGNRGAAGRRGPHGAGAGARGGQAGARAAAGADRSATANDWGGARLGASIARLDELQALRLTKLAERAGLDPATVMPPESLRQAALASDDLRSEASQALLESYRAASMALEGE